MSVHWGRGKIRGFPSMGVLYRQVHDGFIQAVGSLGMDCVQ
jgi:hypothetical protein